MTDTSLGGEPVIFLSSLLKCPVYDRIGQKVSAVVDVAITLDGRGYPPVTGLLLGPDQCLFAEAGTIAAMTAGNIQLDVAAGELAGWRESGSQVLLAAEVLKYRVLDLQGVRLVGAVDIALTGTRGRWAVTGIDVYRVGLWQRLTDHTRRQVRAWDTVEVLVGHPGSVGRRSSRSRLTDLKATQIADLLQDAHPGEQDEILGRLHAHPQLEAHVFDQLDDDRQARLLATRSDIESGAVLARMDSDDAADAVMELPQDRRLPVLQVMPEQQRGDLITLLGYAQSTAGGLMSLDFLSVPAVAAASDAQTAVRYATGKHHQALSSVLLVDGFGHLTGMVSVVAAVQAAPDTLLLKLADRDPNQGTRRRRLSAGQLPDGRPPPAANAGGRRRGEDRRSDHRRRRPGRVDPGPPAAAEPGRSPDPKATPMTYDHPAQHPELICHGS